MVLFLFAATAPAFAATAEVLKNEKVVVSEETLAPGEQEKLAEKHTSMVVVLNGESMRAVLADGTTYRPMVQRGNTFTMPAQEMTIFNDGRSKLQLVRVEFLTAGSAETWGRTGLAPKYKLLFEDRYSRTYDIRIAAHQWEPQHTHHARVVVCLSGAKLEHVLPDGSIQPSTLKTDEVAWRLGQTHRGHNLGDTDLWVIAIEPK